MQSFQKIMLISATALLGACASTPKAVNVPKFALGEVKLTLQEKYTNPEFYTQEALNTRMRTCVAERLQSAGKVTNTPNAPVLTLNIQYNRIFSGEAFGQSKSLGTVKYGYDYQIQQNNQVLAQDRQNLTGISLGMKQNLKGLATLWTTNTSQSKEDEFINGVCHLVSQKIIDETR